MRILISGYGPFEGVIDNPSARIAKWFGDHGLDGHEITPLVLAVSYARATAAIRNVLSPSRFDAVLVMGVAPLESVMRIESIGRNRDSSNRPDCDGEESKGGPIFPGAPEEIQTSVNVNGLLDRLRLAGIPGRISEDAGGYLCNRGYFTALQAIREAGASTSCLFIHVPADPLTPPGIEGDYMPFDQQIQAIRIALEYMVCG